MEPSTVIRALATLVVVAQVALVVGGALALIPWRGREGVRRWVGAHAPMLGLIVALVALLGSLYFSEVAKFTPCLLCWYQRILIYPQVLLFALLLRRRESGLAAATTILSVLALGFAAYHYGLQMSESVRTVSDGIVPCSTVAGAVSCSDRQTTTFGYITIPLMSFTAAASLLVLGRLSVAHRASR